MNEWWSYLLTAVGLSGFFLAGKKVWWAWYINLGCQALWAAYAVATEQYGFILAAIAYSIVFWRNAWRWTKDRKDVKIPAPPKIKSEISEWEAMLEANYAVANVDAITTGYQHRIEGLSGYLPIQKQILLTFSGDETTYLMEGLWEKVKEIQEATGVQLATSIDWGLEDVAHFRWFPVKDTGD